MTCLFILYTDLVPHLRDLKNDVSSCHAKRKLAAQDVFQHETMERTVGTSSRGTTSLGCLVFLARNGLQ